MASYAKVKKGCKPAKKGGKLTHEQAILNEFLNSPKNKKKSGKLGFSPFIPREAEKAYQLSAKFMEIANENRDNHPIDKVIEYAKEVSKTEDSQLVHNALMTFVTYHPAARKKNLRIPPAVQRSPGASIPKKNKLSLAPGPVVPGKKVEEDEGDIELFMNWFREDPNLNEHHEHWHIVYNGRGIPNPLKPSERVHKDRHGELFLYMHRQMLARYDVERFGLNLPLIAPLDDYDGPIAEGYKPNENLVDRKDDYSTFGQREPNSRLRGSEDFPLQAMKDNRKKIEEAIEADQFSNGTQTAKIDINLLGAVLESYAIEEKKDLIESYGSLHLAGHVNLATLHDDPGVMYDTRVAARDPVFWRWHRHIDDLSFKWEEKQKPNDFCNPPPVKLRDVILTFKNQLPISHGETEDIEAAAFGEQTFGHEHFDDDVSCNKYVTNELQTRMKTRTWEHIEDSGAKEEIDYLFPREFYYFFRVENTSSSKFDATFRVFIVPEELAESRRHWIELDKFKHTLLPNSKTVVCRDSDMSSVVRQPPQKTKDEMDDTSIPFDTVDAETAEDPNKSFCDCGWPYHLLIPRGRKGGQKFKLLVFISDWSQDKVPTLSRCGSISYCGAEGPSENYPDSKPMGYPLDKPFKNNSYKETFAGLNNAIIRDVSINWVENAWEEVFDEDD